MKLESPVKRFPGYVVLPEYLTIPQVQAITKALGDPNEIPGGKLVWQADADVKNVPVVLACISEWHLSGVPENPTVETFPMSPRKSAHDLIQWLAGAVMKLWDAEEEIPNA